MSGTAAATVSQGAGRANTFINSSGYVDGAFRVPSAGIAGGMSRQVISSANRADLAATFITSSGHTITVGAWTLIIGDVSNGERVVNYNTGTCTDAATGVNFVYCDDSGFAGGAVTYFATTLQSYMSNLQSHVYVGKITTTTGSVSSGGTGGPLCVAPETLIRVCDRYGRARNEKRADEVVVGDYVWTRPDLGKANMGAHKVIAVAESLEMRTRVTFEDGRELLCSCNHLLRTRSCWSEAQFLPLGTIIVGSPSGKVESVTRIHDIGPVVKLQVQGARTYLSNGLQSHNSKAY